MWAQRADAWAYTADLPQHVKSAALLDGAHCPKDQGLGTAEDLRKTANFVEYEYHGEDLIDHGRTQKNTKKN
jgi:hypothetical protein